MLFYYCVCTSQGLRGFEATLSIYVYSTPDKEPHSFHFQNGQKMTVCREVRVWYLVNVNASYKYNDFSESRQNVKQQLCPVCTVLIITSSKQK